MSMFFIEFDGCPFGFDSVWNIEWPNTIRNSTSTQQCPGALGAVVGNVVNSMCDVMLFMVQSLYILYLYKRSKHLVYIAI